MTAVESKREVNPKHIGWLFVQQYYTFLHESPERLHLFYNKNSTFTHGKEGEQVGTFYGQKEINAQIAHLDFKKAKVFVTNVDSQSSMSGGVIVQVLGELSNNGDSCQKFCQTFFLAEQPEGYYVLNDLFRFLKEDIDADYDEVEENGVDRAPTFTYQDPAKQVAPKKPSSPVKQEAKPVKPVVKQEEKKAPVVQKEVKQPIPQPAPAPKPAAAPVTKPVQQPVAQQPAKPVQQPVAQQPAKPVQPKAAPTPVQAAVTSAPAQAPAQPARPPSPKKEAKPSAPVAWAKIAAANSDSKPSTPPPPPKPTPAPAPVQQAPAPKAPVVQVQQPKPKEEESDGFKEITRRQPDRRQSTTDEREKTTIYLPKVPESVEKKTLIEVFETVGPIVHIDYVYHKKMAFISFKTAEAAAKAIGQTFTINGETIVPERRKYSNTNPKKFDNNGYRGSGAGYQSRGPKNGNFKPKKDKPANA